MQGKAREAGRDAEQPGVHLVAIAAGLVLAGNSGVVLLLCPACMQLQS